MIATRQPDTLNSLTSNNKYNALITLEQDLAREQPTHPSTLLPHELHQSHF